MEATLRKLIINRFVDSYDNMDRLIPNQIQQTWSRIFFAVGGLIYLSVHGDFLSSFDKAFLISAAVYFIYNFTTLYTVRRTPLSAFRMLFGPLLDTWVVSLGMMIDGGQQSGLYLVFFIIIFGNALRFGNTMLLYSQALSIAGVISVSLSTLFGLHMNLDETLLFMQCVALIVVPTYAMEIKKQANEAMQAKQKAEDATFGLLDHGPLPAFTFHLDEEGLPRILYANLAMQNVYRDSSINLIGEQVDILALMEDGDEIIKACQYAFSEKGRKEPFRFYIRGRDAGDQLIQLMGQSMRLHWNGKWVGVCFLLDITRTEAVRNELEQSMQASFTNTLLAGIVHDFRNILTSMIGTAEVMNFNTKDENIRQQLQLIMDAGDRGSNMINHLLSLSQVEHEQARTSASSEAIHQSLTSIVGLLRIQLPPHIQLHLMMEENLPSVSASITQIEQIVTNLINNATSAIEKTGHITVSLYSENDEHAAKSQEGLAIRVEDNGSGIPETDIAEITKPFWTSHKETGGTGLGLPTVQHIVRNNEGTMKIESSDGRGTSVLIFLPAAQQEPLPSTSDSKPEPVTNIAGDASEELTFEPSTILLVDDNPEVLLVHQTQLERMGHKVFTAMNGISGLEVFDQNRDAIRMIITDYKMPKMDGVELSAAIREREPDIPILMITAYAEVENLQKGSMMGIHILGKPATYKKLGNTIARIQAEA